MLYRVVFLLLTLRLLAPPGICLCHYQPITLWFLTGQTNTNLPPHDEDDHDHEPGCPASFLAGGMAVKPAHVASRLLLAPGLTTSLPDLPAADHPPLAHAHTPSPAAAWPPHLPPYLCHCALLI